MSQNHCPIIAIVGLDPSKHVIPPLLMHHLKKMSKDFKIGFIDTPDLSERTGEALKKMVDESGFVPLLKGEQPVVVEPSGLVDVSGRPL